MSNHSARDHAPWSASATARNWACPGSFALAQTVAQPPESEAAAWGTACHQVAEKCLNAGFDAVQLVGRHEKTKDRFVEVTDEMAECAQEYVDYVRRLATVADSVKIEQKFSLAKIKPPMEAGGTADAVVYTKELRLLEVVDLKGGRGVVVDAKGNPQLRTYALGAVLANPGLDVERVQVTIVQPRAPHKEGRIRSEVFHIADLMEWANDLLEAMQRAVAPDAPFEAGDHCRFCPAAAVCPALREKSLAEARMVFAPIDEPMAKPNSPDSYMPEEIARILDHADMIENWLNAVRAYAHAQAESGVVIPGYQLADKRATAKWKVEPEKVIGQLELMSNLPLDEIAPRKLRTPKQLEKALGAQKNLIDGLWAAESSGTNLVSSKKSTRPPVTPKVNQVFQPIQE